MTIYIYFNNQSAIYQLSKSCYVNLKGSDWKLRKWEMIIAIMNIENWNTSNENKQSIYQKLKRWNLKVDKLKIGNWNIENWNIRNQVFPDKSIFDIDGENRMDTRYRWNWVVFFKMDLKSWKTYVFTVSLFQDQTEKKKIKESNNSEMGVF